MLRDHETTPHVESLLRAMTLDEKLGLLRGAVEPEPSVGVGGAGYVPGVPRLGVPPLRMVDGPAGIRTWLPATALPAPVALSASFNPELARRFGEVMGREGRARSQDVLLSPMVNIVRVPQAGRNFETLGEDPLLASRLVAEQVRGIQGAGLLATVKHFVANNFENDRLRVSADVDERTLQEIYLPAFEAAVDAGVAAVMGAYNRVNGRPACGDPALLTGILREQLGFGGWVMTDWFALHELSALEAGLDQEMPGFDAPAPEYGGPSLFGGPLREALRSGAVPEAAVDRAVRRILTQMERFGLLDGSAGPRPEIDPQAGSAVAREVALRGAVLLRNEGVLPLKESDLAGLVVIGPTARRPLVGGGGSARVLPLRTTAVLEALGRMAGPGARIRHLEGIDLDGVVVPPVVLAPAVGEQVLGLVRTAADGSQRIDPEVDYTGESALPPGSAWRWSGILTPPTAGEYTLVVHSRGGRASLSVEGELVARTGEIFGTSLIPTADGLQRASAVVRLEAGIPVALEVTADTRPAPFMAPASEPLQVRLTWVTPGRRRQLLSAAADAARAAAGVVLLAHDEGTESRDRTSLSLPEDQDPLIEAVTQANPRTVVVLQTGSAVVMPWVERAGAVLQMWYPGQEGGEAAAALLLGQANPAGKLPVTFPRSEADAPTAPVERYPGVDGRAVYSEGVLVGYRWYDTQGIEPLFPFGHGLSYTKFDYSDLSVAAIEGGGFEVRFRVRNSGARPGAEVAQVYVGAPADPPVPMARRQLAGFDRVELDPGEQREVVVPIGVRQLSYWSPFERGWVVACGKRAVDVGSSSRDTRLRGELEVRTPGGE